MFKIAKTFGLIPPSVHFTYIRNGSIRNVNASKWHKGERQLINGTSVISVL